MRISGKSGNRGNHENREIGEIGKSRIFLTMKTQGQCLQLNLLKCVIKLHFTIIHHR
jgi:hypothetical protein